MHREGHYGVALLTYAPVVFVLVALDLTQLALLGGAVIVGGAMVPDLDQRVPGVTHRGPTHTVWFALATGVAVGVIGAVLGWSRGILPAVGLGLFGFLVGGLTIVAHLLADVLTPAGIRPFTPIRDTKHTLDVATASNPVANYGLLAAGVLVATAAVGAGAALRGSV